MVQGGVLVMSRAGRFWVAVARVSSLRASPQPGTLEGTYIALVN
jgi:hypothetical protein